MTAGTDPTTQPRRAGGQATEAGMAFQAAVGTWFAAHILAGSPVGGRFGIGNTALPLSIRLETGEALDDIEVTMSDGGSIHAQCKTSATLSASADGPLGKTLGQLAIWVADAKLAGSPPDPANTAAILAVHTDASRNLDHLEAGCRAFALGGTWATTCSQRNSKQQNALEIFDSATASAWRTHRGLPPQDDDFTDMARVFHLARFTMEEGSLDWRGASRLIGRNLYG